MASSSTPSNHKRFNYDVFLSFRGEDTRTNFVDHLYYALQQKGIHTYKDDERIKKGNKICDELIRSIEDSKLYVIVFSKNYASSSWCLDELVKIMECHNPVFYDVEPSEVRKQSGAVGKAFAKHENEDSAGRWREALKEAADLAGWELKNTADRHEAKFIQKIIEGLSLELRDINFNIDENLVGMETRINNVLSSLEIGFDDVRMIGIKGIGGGGKTTLARVIFDQISFRFEGKSYVENVREVSKASLSGLKSLQKQILSDVLNDHSIKVRSVYDGKIMMMKRMSCKKVLLVLDDVDHIEQLEALAGETNWFKSGSRIIITTRDEQVLVAHRVKSIYNVQLLLDVEAIRHFSRYAFGRVIPNVGYEELSQQVVHYAAGLPLTLKVLGSFLCGKKELEWIDALKRLKTIPLMETLQKLEISYISLEQDYKEIFLNIACILKGWSKASAIEALESCGFHAINGLKVLEQKSLITLDHHANYAHGEYLGMHDHIEELGKNIVRRLHPDKPNEHSRLWIDDEIEDILTNNLGTKATRYIEFSLEKLSPEVVMKGLRKMKGLRFLYVNGGDIATISDSSCQNWKFSKFANALQYLSWCHYPYESLPETFQADNLVALVMTDSRIVQLWEGGERKVLKKLRFLYLSYSDLRTLDLGLAPNLEILDLKRCPDLIELRLPHKCLNLKYLNLHDTSLKTLDIGLSPNLEYLNLRNCYDLEEFHMVDECLKKLVYLDLSGCVRFRCFLFLKNSDTDAFYANDFYEEDICTEDDGSSYHTEDYSSCSEDESLEGGPSAELHLLAKSLDQCPFHLDNNLPKFQFKCYYAENQPLLTRNLEKLISVGPCACTNLDTFSRSICGLQHLRKLKLQGRIVEAPKDLDQLECLEKLEFSHTNIKHIPDNICMLKHLKSLKIKSCSLLKKLPDELGRLECLKKLALTKAKIKDLPNSICMLKDLECLKLHCWLLQRLPENLGQLECLKKLTLTSKKIRVLPDSICMLKDLESLKLYCCLLEKLPENLGRLECLKKLTLASKNIKDLPDSICMLKHLVSFNLVFGSSLEELPEDIGRLECLETLNLGYCESLRVIPDGICNMKCLKHLNLDNCIQLEKLPEELGRLECLEKLNIENTCISHLPQSIFLLKRLLIVASREFLESCGFASVIRTSKFNVSCYVEGQEVFKDDFERLGRPGKKSKNN